MKERKIEVSLLAICALFVCFTLGLFVGRNTGGHDIRVQTERQTETAVVETNEQEATPAGVQEAPEEHGQAEQELLDLNTATEEQLMTLPGIGPVLAQRIVVFREANGPFISVEQLTDVEGVGEKKLDAIREYLRIGEQK